MNNASTKNSRKFTLLAASAFVTLMLIGAASERAFAIAFIDPTGNLPPSNSQGPFGWVGKGDVQNAFDPTWNNKQLQERANFVDFVLQQSTTYSVTVQWFSEHGSGTDQTDEDTVCEFVGGPPGPKYMCTDTHTVTQTKITSLDATINADPRQSPKQFTGFKLVAAVIEITGDEIPDVGDSCPNGGPTSGCTVTDVTQTGSGDPDFYAVWNNNGTPVNSNPIPVTVL
jgi:hypothetical protein